MNIHNMNINIKYLNDKAVQPVKTHERDFCYDCVATSCEDLGNGYYRYGLGFAMQFSDEDIKSCQLNGYVLSFSLKPRSSVWKTGMILTNCIGVGDEDYTGEYQAIFYHLDKTKPKYEVGDRILQFNVEITPQLGFIEVEELRTTERGDGGYGSTGL